MENLMGESNTVVSAYTTYRHLQQYCSHPWRCSLNTDVHSVRNKHFSKLANTCYLQKYSVAYFRLIR